MIQNHLEKFVGNRDKKCNFPGGHFNRDDGDDLLYNKTQEELLFQNETVSEADENYSYNGTIQNENSSNVIYSFEDYVCKCIVGWGGVNCDIAEYISPQTISSRKENYATSWDYIYSLKTDMLNRLKEIFVYIFRWCVDGLLMLA